MQANQFNNLVILNVDDSDGARYAKSRILKRAEFKVIEAVNGGDALARARSERPALILLDTKLPDINGFEVCRQLKSDPATQSIMILQTSASYLKASDKINAIEGGADNYLFEPIEPDELIANVKALLRLGRVEHELREMNRRKDEFLATLAHELRNPLGPIRTSVALLCKLDPDAPELQAKARQTIMRQTDHMVHLVNDLLDVSRISQGKITLALEPVELQTYINCALETSALLIATRRHHLSVHLPQEKVWVNGDPVRLTQIVSNLMQNAAKFTPEGGKIALDIKVVEHELVIRISDNGIGIEAINLEPIFNLFTQEGHSVDRVKDGLGIGLSLVRSLVKLHNGSVRADSPGLGSGSTFEVRLPTCTFIQAAAGSRTPDKKASDPLRILVVDDNVDAADMLAELLAFVGHQVQKAHTGRQGLAHAEQFQPDVVFLDIGLPDLTGYQVARKLREMWGVKKLILIALTGYGRDEDRKLALDAGFDQHLVKPLDFSKLTALNLRIE